MKTESLPPMTTAGAALDEVDKIAAYGMPHPVGMLAALVLDREGDKTFTAHELATSVIQAQGAEPGYTSNLTQRMKEYCGNGLVRAGLAFETKRRGTYYNGVTAYGATERLQSLGVSCIGLGLDLELSGIYSAQDVLGRPQFAAGAPPSSLVRLQILDLLNVNGGTSRSMTELRDASPRCEKAVDAAVKKLTAADVVKVLRAGDSAEGMSFAEQVHDYGGYPQRTAVILTNKYAGPVSQLLSGLRDIRDGSSFHTAASARARHILSNPYAVSYLAAKAREHGMNIVKDRHEAAEKAAHLARNVAGWLSLQDELALTPRWRKIAECRGDDVDDFFPARNYQPPPATVELAKEICGACRVSTECLHAAITGEEEFGVWAGRTPDDRRAISPGLRLLLKSIVVDPDAARLATLYSAAEPHARQAFWLRVA